MKKIATLLFLLLAISSVISGQNESKQSISLRILGIQEKPFTSIDGNYGQRYYSPTGIGFSYQKLLSKKHSLRVVSIYRGHHKTYSNEDFYSFDKYNEIQIKIGYQRQYLFNRLEYYGGIDVVAVHGKYINETGWNENLVTNSAFGAYRDTRIRSRIGLSPFLGLNYHFNKKWSIGFETNIQFMRNWSDYNYQVLGEPRPMNEPFRIIFGNVKNSFEANPLAALTLNYHF